MWNQKKRKEEEEEKSKFFMSDRVPFYKILEPLFLSIKYTSLGALVKQWY